MEAVKTLKNIQRSPKPNSAFFATQGLETVAEVDHVLPVYPLSAGSLFAKAIECWGDQKNTRLAERNDQNLQARFVCTTPLLRFKDDIDVEVVPISESEAGLILFSRSRIGYSDLGTNRKRLAHWVEQLEQFVKNA